MRSQSRSHVFDLLRDLFALLVAGRIRLELLNRSLRLADFCVEARELRLILRNLLIIKLFLYGHGLERVGIASPAAG